jgi:hypothetical protein
VRRGRGERGKKGRERMIEINGARGEEEHFEGGREVRMDEYGKGRW